MKIQSYVDQSLFISQVDLRGGSRACLMLLGAVLIWPSLHQNSDSPPIVVFPSLPIGALTPAVIWPGNADADCTLSYWKQKQNVKQVYVCMEKNAERVVMPLTFRFVRPLGNARLRHPEWCFSIAGSQFHSVSCHWIHVVDNLPFSQLSVMRCCDRYVLTRLSDALGVCLCACGFHLCLNPLFLLLQPVILCPVVSKPTLQRARRVFFFFAIVIGARRDWIWPMWISAYFDLSVHLFKTFFFEREREPSLHTIRCQLGSQSVNVASGIINNAL